MLRILLCTVGSKHVGCSSLELFTRNFADSLAKIPQVSERVEKLALNSPPKLLLQRVLFLCASGYSLLP